MCSVAVFAQAHVLQVEQRTVLCHVQVLTASVLVRRFLSLSGRIGTTLVLGTPWNLSNVGNAELDLFPDDKSLFLREL